MGNNQENPKVYKLGQKITVTEVIEGKGEWKKRKLKEPITGIITGQRTLRKGYTERDDGIHWFVQTGSIKALMVTYNLHRKPVFIEKENILDNNK